MKLTHFRDLLAVVHTGSLRAASRSLNIAQPVISRSIRELERDLGVVLLERHSKGAALTPAGERFVRRIEAIQVEIQRARDEALQWEGELVGEVAIALSPIASMVLLPRAIATFNRQYPQAVVKITQDFFVAVEQKLTDGLIDFWIGPVDPRSVSQKFSVEHLLPYNHVIAARRGHPMLEARGFNELNGASWASVSFEDRRAEKDLGRLLKELNLPDPKIVVYSPSMLVTILTVANTDLLTVFPEQIFKIMPLAEFCVPLAHVPLVPSAPICIVRRQGLPLTPLSEKLCDLMRKAALNTSL